MRKIKRVEIFDRDGTLTCSLHRTRIDERGLLDLGHWLAHHTAENIVNDKVLPCGDYYRECVKNPEIYTVICTVARLKPADYEFIEKHLGKPDKYLFPKKNVGKKGASWKRQVLGMFKNLKQFKDLPVHFHEDNMKYLVTVCDAWGFIGHYYPSGYGIAGVTNVPADLETM